MAKLVDRLLRLASEHARRVLVDHGDEHMSLIPVFAIYAKGEISLLATPWRNDSEKALAQMAVRRKIKAEQANAYSFVSEAWMLAYDKKEHDDLKRQGKPLLMPSQSERRIEIVLAVAVAKTDAGLDKRFQVWEILRNPSGRIIHLRNHDSQSQADQFGGVMAALMDD